MTHPEMYFLLIALALSAVSLAMLWIAMFADIFLTKSDVWLAAGHDRLFCLLLVVALGPVGAILYGIFVRPQLARTEFKIAVQRARPPAKWAA